MLSEVKNIISPDIIDFSTYRPENEESFSFLITVIAGPAGTAVEESFNVVVCTPRWLLDKYDENEIILGKGKLIVFKYDMDRILARMRKIFDSCSGKDWNEIAMKLSRIGHWEFEDYQE